MILSTIQLLAIAIPLLFFFIFEILDWLGRIDSVKEQHPRL